MAKINLDDLKANSGNIKQVDNGNKIEPVTVLLAFRLDIDSYNAFKAIISMNDINMKEYITNEINKFLELDITTINSKEFFTAPCKEETKPLSARIEKNKFTLFSAKLKLLRLSKRDYFVTVIKKYIDENKDLLERLLKPS